MLETVEIKCFNFIDFDSSKGDVGVDNGALISSDQTTSRRWRTKTTTHPKGCSGGYDI
jgi:hypothetical protein